MSLSAHSTHQRLDILACSQQTQIRNEPLKHKRSQISHTQKKYKSPLKIHQRTIQKLNHNQKSIFLTLKGLKLCT
jgi:hypothetical protein